MYVFVCELSARCKIAPWLQSKSMQSKQEMATIEETEGGGGGRVMEARRQMESWTVRQRKRGEVSSWQCRLESVTAEIVAERRMSGCCSFSVR